MLARVARQQHPQASIDWASAEVSGGDLTVALRATPNADWAARAQAASSIASSAPSSGWGATKVTKAKIAVKDVTAGAEDDLRLLLDGAVQQANADFAPRTRTATTGLRRPTRR